MHVQVSFDQSTDVLIATSHQPGSSGHHCVIRKVPTTIVVDLQAIRLPTVVKDVVRLDAELFGCARLFEKELKVLSNDVWDVPSRAINEHRLVHPSHGFTVLKDCHPRHLFASLHSLVKSFEGRSLNL